MGRHARPCVHPRVAKLCLSEPCYLRGWHVKSRKRKTIDLLTPDEVANQLKVSVFTVRRWINQDELPAYRIGRAWRISADELASWLEKRQKRREMRTGH